MAGAEGEKRLDRQAAWYVKWGGLGVAIISAIVGVGALVVPGLLSATGGFAYEQVTTDKADKPVRRRGKLAPAT